jgi:DNA-binding transcriptional ArsR family regulator
MLEMLSSGVMGISELARPLSMSLPAAVKHLKVLADAGLIEQQKTGRIQHCRLEEGPLVEATVWLSRHCKYWQNQFETLAAFLAPVKQEDLRDGLQRTTGADQRTLEAGHSDSGKDDET